MAVGPVQLIVLGFNHPNFQVRCSAASSGYATRTRSGHRRARGQQDADGDVAILKMDNLTRDERIELDLIGSLIGIGAPADSEEAVEEMALAGAEVGAEEASTCSTRRRCGTSRR